MPTPKTKQSSTAPVNPKVQLPEHISLSETELSMTVRLVKLMRAANNYWLKYFVQHILQKEADSTEGLTVKGVEDMLATVRGLDSWTGWVPEFVYRYPYFATHPAIAFTQNRGHGSSVAPEEEDQFYELVKLWRKDHPEPEKRRPKAPAGRLGQQEEED